jgi:hypothetical protein
MAANGKTPLMDTGAQKRLHDDDADTNAPHKKARLGETNTSTMKIAVQKEDKTMLITKKCTGRGATKQRSEFNPRKKGGAYLNPKCKRA